MRLCATARHCCRSRLTHLHLQISLAACVGSHLPNLVFGTLFSVWIPSRGCKLIACCTASSLHAMSLMPRSLHRCGLTASPSVASRLLTSSCTMIYLSRSVCQPPYLQTADSNNLLCGSVYFLDAAVCPGRYSTNSFCRGRSALTSKSVLSLCSSTFEHLGAQSN